MGLLRPVSPAQTCTPCSRRKPGQEGGWKNRKAPLGHRDSCLFSSDPEPTAVPRHGPVLVQHGHVLLFKHSYPRQTIQVRSPGTALAQPWHAMGLGLQTSLWQGGALSRFLGEKTRGGLQGTDGYMSGPSPHSPASPSPWTTPCCLPTPAHWAFVLRPETHWISCSEWALSQDRQTGLGGCHQGCLPWHGWAPLPAETDAQGLGSGSGIGLLIQLWAPQSHV